MVRESGRSEVKVRLTVGDSHELIKVWEKEAKKKKKSGEKRGSKGGAKEAVTCEWNSFQNTCENLPDFEVFVERRVTITGIFKSNFNN